MQFDPKLATFEDATEAKRLAAYYGQISTDDACLLLAMASRICTELKLKISYQRKDLAAFHKKVEAEIGVSGADAITEIQKKYLSKNGHPTL